QKNTDLFPNSANAYHSLAEVYMQSGDVKNAILNYRKSLELNPNNEHAARVLAEYDPE
ncbi:MAG: tetratricopeptide repeat protein, partial [Bacteroidota bacterium]